jgi:SagB-type dehydrogenase family enzyme
VLVDCVPLTIGESPTAVATLPANAGTSVPSQAIALPAPRLKGGLSLEEALSRRRSVRDFAETPLTMAELGQLLWAAQGITSSDGGRTAPSAGALYPLEVYAVLPEAVYHYEPQGHRLSVHTAGDRRAELYSAALRQEAVLKAPVVIVIAAAYERTARKYGEERAPRYVQLEGGHAAQNILLQAVAMDLGAVPVGAFEDDQVQRALALPPDQKLLYLIPVGHPEQ